MTWILWLLLLILQCVNLGIGVAGLLVGKKDAGKEPEDKPDKPDKPDEAGRLMDEGFENLMRYSVRGKDGFS